MEINMDLVKYEGTTSACNSCLSVGRRMSPLADNGHLFVHLLGDRGYSLDPNSIFICWECLAILKKMSKFQRQAQYAQIVLQENISSNNIYESLSNLSKIKLDDINIITDEFSNNETNGDVQNEMLSLVPVIVKNEASMPDDEKCLLTLDDDNSNIEYDTNFEDNIPLENPEPDVEIKLENQNETSSIIKKTNLDNVPSNKYFQFNNKVERTVNPDVNVEDFRSCYTETVMTETDIENLGGASENSIKTERKDSKTVKSKKCHKCEKKIQKDIDLKRHKTFCHILKEESTGPFRCLECGTSCSNQSSLRAHWSAHNTVMKCKICAKVVPSTRLKSHAESHVYLWTCKLCTDLEKVCRSYKEFTYHHHTIHRYSNCDYCGWRGKTKASLLHHIQLKHLPPRCDICRKDFKSVLRLRRHQSAYHPRIRDPESTYCVECDKHFPSPAKYKLHLNATLAHNPAKVQARKKIVPCPECGKQFTRTTYMNNHRRQVHSKESKHYCQLCDKYLVSAWSMKKHVQGVHQKIREPKTKICDECGRAFQTNAVLIKHIRTHTGERPYKCAHCPAAFTQSSALYSHTRTQHKVA